MEEHSGDVSSSLTAAYKKLKIDDPTISDKDVGAAYLHARASAAEQSAEALRMIAKARDSRWLQSAVRPSAGPLAEEYVPKLQDEAHSVPATTSDIMFQPTSKIFGPIATAIEPSKDQQRADEKSNARANEEAIETVDTDDTDSSELDSLSSQSTYAPSSSEDSASDSYVEVDSDDASDREVWFEWDDESCEGGFWACDCREPFVDGKCPFGHCSFCKSCGWTIVGDCRHCPNTCQGCGGDKVRGVCAECSSTKKTNITKFTFCKSCGWNIIGDCLRCPNTCQRCGEDKVNGVCAKCDPKKEEIQLRGDIIIFDRKDSVWRCSECLWEIEADNETDGNCHCVNEEGGLRMVDVSQIPEYKRADDAASSTEFSSDEEEDSDDESFIDDSEDVMELERLRQCFGPDPVKEAGQGGEFMDSNATIDGQELRLPTSSGPDNSKG